MKEQKIPGNEFASLIEDVLEIIENSEILHTLKIKYGFQNGYKLNINENLLFSFGSYNPTKNTINEAFFEFGGQYKMRIKTSGENEEFEIFVERIEKAAKTLEKNYQYLMKPPVLNDKIVEIILRYADPT